MDKLGIYLPIGIVVLIFFLKLFVNESFSFETFKRVFVGTPIDITSLGISFMISYIITTANKILHLETISNIDQPQLEILKLNWNNFAKGLIILFFYVIILVIIVFILKHFISKYSEIEKMRYMVFDEIFTKKIKKIFPQVE